MYRYITEYVGGLEKPYLGLSSPLLDPPMNKVNKIGHNKLIVMSTRGKLKVNLGNKRGDNVLRDSTNDKKFKPFYNYFHRKNNVLIQMHATAVSEYLHRE